MKRESSDDNRYPRGEERYTWDSRRWDEHRSDEHRWDERRSDEHRWDERDQFSARHPWQPEEEEQPSWLRSLERFFLRLVVLGLVALVVVQLWQQGSFGGWLQFTRFEGKAVSPDQLQGVSGGQAGTTAGPVQVTVTLVNLQSAPAARRLVDEREAGRFGGASLTVTAGAGSELRLDPGTDRRSLTFRITALSDRARLPRLGSEVTVSGTPVSLGKVQ